MQLLYETEGGGRHDHQVTSPIGPGVPERVRDPPRPQDCRAYRGLPLLAAELKPQGSLEHVPRLALVMVYVQWRNEPRWTRRASRVRTLGDRESPISTPDCAARQRRYHDC